MTGDLVFYTPRESRHPFILAALRWLARTPMDGWQRFSRPACRLGVETRRMSSPACHPRIGIGAIRAASRERKRGATTVGTVTLAGTEARR